MLPILVATILTVLALFTGLTVAIVVGKAWREAVALRRRRRRAAIEPDILRFAHGGSESLLPALGGALAWSDRAVVESILLDHVERVRGIENERLCRALEELGFVDRYLEATRSARWWQRASAAEKLGLSRARRSREALVALLEDEVGEVRIRAAKALGAVGGHASAIPLIEALQEPNRWSTIRVADILASMGRTVTEELMRSFESLTPPARLAALDILGRVRPLDAVPWLRQRLSDGDRDVRARAAHALGAIGEPGSGPALTGALDDPDWPVRAMAAKALGRVHSHEAIPALERALRDREWWVRANAAEALRALGADGIAALERALDDPDRYARHQAVVMLQESGDLDRRIDALGAGDPAEVVAARAWLARVARAGQHARLVEVAERHPTPAVRERLAELLATERARGPAAAGGTDGEGAR